MFSRGWGKMKLYFMIGLPTETIDDVRGVVETGARAAQAGKRAAGKGKPIEVTVSVSTHVPKPHTPFQWCAMDTLGEVATKQAVLREEARKHRAVKLRTHEANASVLEGIFARGDRPLAVIVLERAFKSGAAASTPGTSSSICACGKRRSRTSPSDRAKYLGTIPGHGEAPHRSTSASASRTAFSSASIERR